jgi:predicted phage terminase large subunit-like protein
LIFTADMVRGIQNAPFHTLGDFYDDAWSKGNEAIAELATVDRYFLLTMVMKRKDAIHPWLYKRCREVERNPDDHLDLWAREHYKSTLITFAGIIQELLRDPEITIGIFSFNNKTATKFLNQIKMELEDNVVLKTVFPDILYDEPRKKAPAWSEQKGIIVKRKSNPKEATVEAHGLVEGMPTGAHYELRVYDDVITEDSVTNPEMIEKVTNAWRLSSNLGKEGGRQWHIGTRYHFNDTYRVMLDENILVPRSYPATHDGTPSGKPVLIAQSSLEKKRKVQGPYIFSCQQLLNPVADDKQGFDKDWIEYFDENDGHGMNRYILVDPANEKKKQSDYSAYFVVGLGQDSNYYVLDIVRDRLNLTERWQTLWRLHKQWKPKGVGYEKYGKDSDIQHFESEMKRENYRFNITPLGGLVKKEDRIRRLIPIFEQHRMYLPECLFFTTYDGKNTDVVKTFVEQEYMGFPVAIHDDMLDCLARILDDKLSAIWPQGGEDLPPTDAKPRDRYADANKRNNRSWMST